MLTPLIRRPRRKAEPRSNQRGFTMAFVALTMAVLISMAALAIDIGTLYQAKAEAQRAADAAALSAARVISISGITTDPNQTGGSWPAACGGANSTATLTAIDTAQQNLIGGVAVPKRQVTVNYVAGKSGTSNADCSLLGADFGVNPIVTVSVQRSNLPVYFARIFSLFGGSYSSASVSATASAEAFNPSGSIPLVPVQPRCVKPWFVPNEDPGKIPNPFVSGSTGGIQNPGVVTVNNGDIGETFNLIADCSPLGTTGCALIGGNQPQATPTTLQYVPGAAPASSVAVAANSKIAACSSAAQNAAYWNAVAGCDQSTAYACGTSLANTVDLSENLGVTGNDSVTATHCLINAGGSGLGNGQDYLAPAGLPPPYTYPFQIMAGTNSALVAAGIAGGSQITNSPSIVSLPIYDNATTIAATGTTPVTVMGFLQVFINGVDTTNGTINVTVMNVAGCGNAATNAPVFGTSPVPVRLITPP